jgi:hypothetical protein
MTAALLAPRAHLRTLGSDTHQEVDLAGIWLAKGFRVCPSVRTLCGDFGTPRRVDSVRYQVPALPCGDRAADPDNED